MYIYENDNIVVRPSPIEGLGVFSKRSFKQGEIVLKWNPKILTKQEVADTPEVERRYLNTLSDDTVVLMQIPERYVNSSEYPNTKIIEKSDIAVRDIKEGEEITSNYSL